MTLIEDDAVLRPEIDEHTLLYIAHINEGHEAYERYFDALLIKRTSHRAFFNDLRAFRQIPLSIATLERAGTDKSFYRQVTVQYLGSTYAHPWCRKTPLKKGFWRSEWGPISGQTKNDDTVREENRLHKLLVPIWITMRTRMFPGEDTVKAWVTQEKERRQQLGSPALTESALNAQHAQLERDAAGSLDGEPNNEQSDDGNSENDQASAAHAATSVLRLAAAGAILSKTPKRKLRWLTKKP